MVEGPVNRYQYMRSKGRYCLLYWPNAKCWTLEDFLIRAAVGIQLSIEFTPTDNMLYKHWSIEYMPELHGVRSLPIRWGDDVCPDIGAVSQMLAKYHPLDPIDIINAISHVKVYGDSNTALWREKVPPSFPVRVSALILNQRPITMFGCLTMCMLRAVVVRARVSCNGSKRHVLVCARLTTLMIGLRRAIAAFKRLHHRTRAKGTIRYALV